MSGSADNYTVGLRLLDIEHGLRTIQPHGVVEGELANTLLLGKAATLALHLRGIDVVEKMDGLRYAAGEMGIRATELNEVLRELAEIGWVRLKSTGNRIARVEVTVPILRDGFDTLGERWKSLKPTEIETASVNILADAVTGPFDNEELSSRFGLDSEMSGTVVEIGEVGTYLKRRRLPDGQVIVYSPLFSDANPERAYSILDKFSRTEIGTLIGQVHGHQGTPAEQLSNISYLRQVIESGLLLAPTVKDKSFLFAPNTSLSQEESIILDKARAILACVRYGQEYAGITKIRYPRLILDALIERKTLKPHSEHAEQYGLLVAKTLGHIDKVGSRYQFRIYDTPDNMKALRVAREMLETGDSIGQKIDDDTRLRLLNPKGHYATPVIERVKLSRSAPTGAKIDARTIDTLSDFIRGARSG